MRFCPHARLGVSHRECSAAFNASSVRTAESIASSRLPRSSVASQELADENPLAPCWSAETPVREKSLRRKTPPRSLGDLSTIDRLSPCRLPLRRRRLRSTCRHNHALPAACTPLPARLRLRRRFEGGYLPPWGAAVCSGSVAELCVAGALAPASLRRNGI